MVVVTDPTTGAIKNICEKRCEAPTIWRRWVRKVGRNGGRKAMVLGANQKTLSAQPPAIGRRTSSGTWCGRERWTKKMAATTEVAWFRGRWAREANGGGLVKISKSSNLIEEFFYKSNGYIGSPNYKCVLLSLKKYLFGHKTHILSW